MERSSSPSAERLLPWATATRLLPSLVGGPCQCVHALANSALRVTRGAEHIGTYSKSSMTNRKWCRQCGGHLFGEHPGLKLVDVFAAMIPTLKFQPGVHVNYQDTVLRMRDGLPKLRDFPKEFGGSGEMLPD